MEGKYRACMVVGNQVIIYSQDPTSLSSFVYNVMDHSFEQVLEPIGIEYQGYTIYALHGGYVVGNIDQKLAIVNLMNGVIVYPDIDYTKFAKVFDIDNNVLLCLKDRTQEYIYESEIGPWDIIDKMTGEVMFSGESLIKKTNQGQQAFVKISEEGQVYLGLSLLGEDGKRDIELYELEYETVK